MAIGFSAMPAVWALEDRLEADRANEGMAEDEEPEFRAAMIRPRLACSSSGKRATDKVMSQAYRKSVDVGRGGAGAAGEASGEAVTTGAGVGGASGVWRSRREEWDRRHRRLWLPRLRFR